MGKLVTVYGAKGTGKTTFAINLACALATEKDAVIAIISANMEAGELQVFFGEKIAKEKGIFKSINDSSGRPEMYSTQVNINTNIYLFGVPNDGATSFADDLQKNKFEEMLRKLSVYYDYIIIDASADIRNPITLMGLYKADQVYMIHRSDQKGYLWYKSIYRLLSDFSLQPITANILNNYNLGILQKEYMEATRIGFEFELPDVGTATERENSGRPIFYDKSIESRTYNQQLNKIIESTL